MGRIEIVDDRIFHWRFNSWMDFVRQAETGESPMPNPSNNTVRLEGSERGVRSSRHIGRASWTGTQNFSEAVDLAVNGWREGGQAVSSVMSVLKSMLPVKRMDTEVAYAYVGPGVLDMNRYLMGHPEPWQVFREMDVVSDSPSGRVVKVVFNASMSSGVSKSSLYRKGAVVACLVDTLEHSGFRVDLSLVVAGKSRSFTANFNSGFWVTLETPIKDASEPFDLERFIFAIAHASVFRRLAFSLYEQMPYTFRRNLGIGHWYTYPTEYNPLEAGEGVYIASNSMVESYRDFSNKVSWLVSQLEPYGIELDVEAVGAIEWPEVWLPEGS